MEDIKLIYDFLYCLIASIGIACILIDLQELNDEIYKFRLTNKMV